MKRLLLIVLLVSLVGCTVGLHGLSTPKSDRTKSLEAEATYSYLLDEYNCRHDYPEMQIDNYIELLEKNIKPLLNDAEEAVKEGDLVEFYALKDKIIFEFNHLEYLLFEIDPVGGGGGGGGA